MSNRKSTFFYAVLLSLASITAGMVLASRLELTSGSFAGPLSVPATNSAPLTGAIDATTFRTIAHDQSPSVVSIVVEMPRTAHEVMSNLPPGFEQFFGGDNGNGGIQSFRAQPKQNLPPAQGAGSGFIIDKAGYILTNNHVIENATKITVHFFGDGEFDDGLPAKVVGHDRLTDSALIQLTELPKTPLVEAKFGDSAQMQPGDWVMAIGNPFELSHSVSVGVVSAVGRLDPNLRAEGRDLNMIQTDAAINRGNSGGPLLNVRGEVIGINTEILTDESSGNIGIGFAVPINTIRDILPSLRSGKVVRGLIGVKVYREPFSADQVTDWGLAGNAGALVTTVTAGGPAASAGIKVGDVITAFNGKPVKDSAALVASVTSVAPGTSVPVTIVRGKKSQTLNVKVGELTVDPEPDAPAAAAAPGRMRTPPTQPESKDSGFGLKIQQLTPNLARQLRLPADVKGAVVVTDVDATGAAYQSGVSQGDVILQVNSASVSSLVEADSLLTLAAQSGRAASMIVYRPAQNGEPGEEVFIPIRKR
jgi:serine protease Do